MNDKKIRKLVLAALLAALVCVATMVVQIPSPMQGYVNLGDCFVLLSGWLLGPWYGFAAGGIGSMLADLFLGYAHYAPGTLVIKGLMALVAALMYEKKLEYFNSVFENYEASKYVEMNKKVWNSKKTANATELPVSFETVFNELVK